MDDVAQVFGALGSEVQQWRRCLATLPHQYLDEIASTKWWTATDALIEYAAESINVGATVNLIALTLFGAHVVGLPKISPVAVTRPASPSSRAGLAIPKSTSLAG